MRTIAIFLLLFSVTICNAQKNYVKSETREVILNSGDSIIVTHVLPEGKKIKTTLRKTYYWYLRGKISHNAGNYSGKLLHGGYQVFFDDKLRLSGTFDNGIKKGRWLSWNNDGTINKIVFYKNGNPKIKKGKFIYIIKRKASSGEKHNKIKNPSKVKRNKKSELKESKPLNPDNKS